MTKTRLPSTYRGVIWAMIGTQRSSPSQPAAMDSGLQFNSKAEMANNPRQFPVNISVYMQISFGQASEVSGQIGREHFGATSKRRARGFRVESIMGGVASNLVFTRRFRGGKSVRGIVMGQPIEARLRRQHRSIAVTGMAGEEPISFYLDMTGRVSNWNQGIGLQVVYQSLFSEISGSVDRVAEAVMVAMLVPVLIYRQNPEQV